MTMMIADAVIQSTREELARTARRPQEAAASAPARKSNVPYRVQVPEPLMVPLPSLIRTRIWLALAKIAQGGSARAQGLHAVGDGFGFTYQVDASTRTVTLLTVEQLAEPFATA